jgi:3-methyladenine DNA glycosylase AlkD/uncharacterized protein YdhG (YjbR/CyaY superfamily)
MAVEGFSYGLPAFLIDGKAIAGFAAGKNHCAFYPMSGSVVAALKEDLTKYETSKGAIRFTPGNPLSNALVKKLVKARLAEIDGAQKPRRSTAAIPKSTASQTARDIDEQAKQFVASLRKAGSKKVRDGLARFALPTENAVGISVGELRKMAKGIGKNHNLAEALWKDGLYEARMLAVFIDDPALVTPEQMDRWCKDFDRWGICDTATFVLFDRTPYAWKKIKEWARSQEEFVRRAAFAMTAALSVHDKKSGDEPFAEGLALVERHSTDDRHWVKLAVNWALRSIGKRSPQLHAAAVGLATKLAASENATARWIGKDALRDLHSKASQARLARQKK